MTDRIILLTPMISEIGKFIEDNFDQGYRSVDGYPRQYGHQYEIIMEKSAQESEESTETKPKRGRKAAASEAE